MAFSRLLAVIIVPFLYPACEQEKPPPIIGKECMTDLDCCQNEDESQCLKNIYCDNSSNPGQCLKLCSDLTECNDSELGRNNACVQFDFGGRCMRGCGDSEVCSPGTYCFVPEDIYDETNYRVCYPRH